jgi:hypothetical protein
MITGRKASEGTRLASAAPPAAPIIAAPAIGSAVRTSRRVERAYVAVAADVPNTLETLFVAIA